MQALPAPPESLCIVEMGSEGENRVFSVGGLFLNIGLQNGVLLRTAIDAVTGDLSDTRTRQVTSSPSPSHNYYRLLYCLSGIWVQDL